MKLREIFATGYSIQLAQYMAERQKPMNPQNTFRRLFSFGAIGLAALVITVSMILLMRSSLGDDANSRTFFVFTSLVGSLVFFATIGASLIFLWDGFIGQYIQRLALEDIQVEPEVDEEPVVELPLGPLPAEASPVPAYPRVPVFELSLRMIDEEFVRANDVSTHLLDRQLEILKRIVPREEWNRYHFEESLQFFKGLGPTATVKRSFSRQGRMVIAQVLSMLSNPTTIRDFELIGPLSNMLSRLPNTREVAEPE